MTSEALKLEMSGIEPDPAQRHPVPSEWRHFHNYSNTKSPKKTSRQLLAVAFLHLQLLEIDGAAGDSWTPRKAEIKEKIECPPFAVGLLELGLQLRLHSLCSAQLLRRSGCSRLCSAQPRIPVCIRPPGSICLPPPHTAVRLRDEQCCGRQGAETGTSLGIPRSFEFCACMCSPGSIIPPMPSKLCAQSHGPSSE